MWGLLAPLPPQRSWSGHFQLADVSGARGAVVVAERVVEVRDGHDPDARVVNGRLHEAPEVAVDRHEAVGRAPDEQTRAWKHLSTCPPALPALQYLCRPHTRAHTLDYEILLLLLLFIPQVV